MNPEKKIWGHTTELFRNGTTSTHYLEIKKGGYCSEHRHAQKANVFYLIEGKLLICFGAFGFSDLNGSSVLSEKHRIIRIEPGTWHKFHALTDVKCIEIYDYKYDGVDIERRVEGGLDET